MASSMGGVSLMKLDNGTQILAGARAWFMIYQLQFYPKEISYISGLWENVRRSEFEEQSGKVVRSNIAIDEMVWVK